MKDLTFQRSSFQGLPGAFYQANTAAALRVCLLPSLPTVSCRQLHLHCQCPELGGHKPAQAESYLATVSLVPLQLAWVYRDCTGICQQGLQIAPCCLLEAHSWDRVLPGKLTQLWELLLGQSLYTKVFWGM